MYQVIKRDGKVSGFDIIKIAEAIKKAFEACEKQYNDNIKKEQERERSIKASKS